MKGEKLSSRHWPKISLGLWAATIIALVAWQSGSYGTIVGALAEWQFEQFGFYLPLLTSLLLIGIFAPLPLYLHWLASRRRDRDEVASTYARNLHRAINDAARFRTILVVMMVACLGSCAAALWFLATLPGGTGSVQHLSASVTLPKEPVEGPTEISGYVVYSKISSFDARPWFFGHTVRYAPIVQNGAGDTLVRYFVEMPPVDGRGDRTVSIGAGTAERRQGILKKQGLPSELVRLYENIDYDVNEPHYVLFSSPEAMRRPYILWAAEFGLVAAFFGIFALVQDARRRRLIKRATAEPA